MKRIECFNCRPLQDSKRSLVFHIVCPNDLKFLKVHFFENMENLQDIVLSDCMKEYNGWLFFGMQFLKTDSTSRWTYRNWFWVLQIFRDYKYRDSIFCKMHLEGRHLVNCRDLVSFSMTETAQPHVFSDQTFYYCVSLENVTLAKRIKVDFWSDVLLLWKHLKKIILPESVEKW